MKAVDEPLRPKMQEPALKPSTLNREHEKNVKTQARTRRGIERFNSTGKFILSVDAKNVQTPKEQIGKAARNLISKLNHNESKSLDSKQLLRIDANIKSLDKKNKKRPKTVTIVESSMPVAEVMKKETESLEPIKENKNEIMLLVVDSPPVGQEELVKALPQIIIHLDQTHESKEKSDVSHESGADGQLKSMNLTVTEPDITQASEEKKQYITISESHKLADTNM